MFLLPNEAVDGVRTTSFVRSALAGFCHPYPTTKGRGSGADEQALGSLAVIALKGLELLGQGFQELWAHCINRD